MAITKEVLNELLKDYKGPDDLTGPDGLLKELTKALVERAMEAEMTEQLGYKKNDQAEKDTSDRRNGKTKKTVRSDQGPFEIEVPGIGKAHSSRRSSPNTNANSKASMIRFCRCTPAG